MSRFVVLELGAELGPATEDAVRRAAAPVLLRLLDAAPPFRDDQIVHVRPAGDGATARAILLCRGDGGYHLRLPGANDTRGGDVLARVVALERGSTVFSLERGILARVPARWVVRATDALEVLARFRHPLTPPLFQGGADECLAAVRAKYTLGAEVREYSRLVTALGSEPFELKSVQRWVKPGGHLLDIGCGAGREALGFARAGFRVTGIDIAPGMIAAARANADGAGLAIDFRVQSVTELAEPPGSYDGAFVAFSVLHHIPGRARRILALARIRRALTGDAALILVVAYRGRRGLVSRSRLVDLVRSVGAKIPGQWRVSEPGDGYTICVSDASDPREPVFFHDYAGPHEVRAEIEEAGFVADEIARGWWICRPSGAP